METIGKVALLILVGAFIVFCQLLKSRRWPSGRRPDPAESPWPKGAWVLFVALLIGLFVWKAAAK